MRIFALLSDAYGGYGGIALFNRDVLEALCRRADVDEVIGVPRVISSRVGELPEKLVYRREAAYGIVSYLKTLLGSLRDIARTDLIYCAHINLVPIAWVLGKLYSKPVLLALYGIDAWQPTGRRVTDYLAKRMQLYYSISAFTKENFLGWAKVDPSLVRILPNAIHLDRYGCLEASPGLLKKFGIEGRTVLLTLGRIVSKERAKGFDEVLALLPSLIEDVPDVVYVVAGDGDYRRQLEERARSLGVFDRVVFTGFIDETEKPDLYRAADVFVMPSRGEGFGFVFLEAMACGVPVVASCVDGSRDAVRDGALGSMVDPDDSDALRAAILKALKQPRGVPEGLAYFSFASFGERVGEIVNRAARMGSKRN